MSDKILVDGHVHLYGCADRLRFLEAAWRNLSAAASEANVTEGHWQGCLLFTESARDDGFADLRSAALPNGWRSRTISRDPAALFLNRDGADLLVIAGRQVISAEGIEVLALATTRSFADGVPVAALLAELRAADIPAVLPWGLGKWLGRRGDQVAELMAAQAGPGLFAGDNAGRPPGWRVPLFQRGTVVLPGTDPLPLAGTEERVGGYGFMLDGQLDPDRPAADMAQRLLALRETPPVFGRRCGWSVVLGEQLALRRRKARPGAGS